MGLIWPNWSETEELLVIWQQTVETGLPLSAGSGLEETSAGALSVSYLEKPVCHLTLVNVSGAAALQCVCGEHLQSGPM